MEVNKKINLSRKFWLLLFIVFVILVIIFAGGVFFFSKENEVVTYKNESGGKVFLTYSSDVNGLSIIGAVPMIDKVGAKSDSKYLDFSVQVDVEKNRKVEYELSVRKVEENSTINDNDVRLYLEKEESGTYVSVLILVARRVVWY